MPVILVISGDMEKPDSSNHRDLNAEIEFDADMSSTGDR